MSKLSSAHLRIDGLSKSFPNRRVFTDISFAVPHDDRVGIIGENGSGKTTLLRIIAGELSADTGNIETFQPAGSGLTVGLLHQQPPFPNTTSIHQVLENSVAHLRAATNEVDAAAHVLAETPHHQKNIDDYAAALEEAERLGAWDTDARIEQTIDGLGLADIARETRLDQLSGGQVARLALASLLLTAPEVLLLDEPTNHLDDKGVNYLSKVVSGWHGPVLVVSHDRAFLDQTIVSLLDLDPAPRPRTLDEAEDDLATNGVTRFTGTYSDYLQFRRETRQRWKQQYDDEQAELRRLRAAVNQHQVVGHTNWKPRTETRAAQKFYADRNAKVVARRVNDARSRLAELEQRQIVKPPRQLTFQGLAAAHDTPLAYSQDEQLVRAEQVAMENRLKPISLAITARDKLLITGPNGAGKSTLLNLVAGQLQPSQGQVSYREGLSIGLLAQESDFGNVAGLTPQEIYQQAVGVTVAEQTPLATFGLLAPREEQRPVEDLSTGQRRRLALAIVLADPPDVLLLDEPTNHLSLLLVTELEASINHYPGAIVIASHDRWLRDRWQGKNVHLDP